jgi:hypothetical protein
MSHLEFKEKSLMKNANGIVILITEPMRKSPATSKVFAITADGKRYVVGVCDHQTDNVILFDHVIYQESFKPQAIQKFILL